MSELKSQHSDFQVHSGRHESTLAPEPLVTSDTLSSTASLCLPQMGLVAPFKFNIKREEEFNKEEKKAEEEQLSGAKKERLSYSYKD